MDFDSLQAFTDSVLNILNNWGFIIVIIFGILHPLTENPLSLFNLTLAITILGIPLGYTVVFLSNIIGILLLFYFTRIINEKSNHIFTRQKVSKKAMDFILETDTWRHIVVIGVPFIPTYPIKLAVPFSGMSFKKYLVTLVGAYVFLFFGNSLIYFGVLGIITNNIPNVISYSLLLALVLYIYFGKKLFNLNNKRKSNNNL